MRKSIATVSISGTLPEKLDAIGAARFEAIEVFENDLIQFQGTPRELRAMAADRGLGIDLYQPFRDFEGVTDAEFERNLLRAERKFDVMEALGAPMMLVCSNVSRTALADDARAAAQLYALAERAARRNLRIGYEALAWGRHVSHYDHAWSIVAKADHPHLGVVIDSFHILSLGDDPAPIANIPGDKIFFLQMADAPLLAMDVLQWARHYRCFPGQGQFDLENFLEQVLVTGYSGPLSLEIFNDLFREAPSRRTAIDAMRSLLYLEGQVRNRLERAAPQGSQNTGARVLDRIELFDPPAVPKLAGMSFLEFAVDEDSGRALGALIERLGFRYAGKHRSKHVTLLRQGDINLILNAEPNSPARAYFDERGPSICATGLRTDDPVRALNRATALQCARVDTALGPRELRIPAIRAPDGGAIYFVSVELGTNGPFDIDFELGAGDTRRHLGAGLQSIDHIAFGLPEDELDT